jgi:hypothetical protein
MAEEKEGADWLFPNAERQKSALEEKGLVFAQKYLVFAGPTSDPRARDLLQYWTATVRKRRIPPNATVQEYAAANAFRELVEGIHQQIEFANQGLNQPKTRT